MTNSEQNCGDDMRSYMDQVCDNCGRDIEAAQCPYCGFVYKADEDENGIFYH